MARCYVCNKEDISRNEIGLSKKLINKNTKRFFCIKCLAEQLEVHEDELLEKIEEFKSEGCKLFE